MNRIFIAVNFFGILVLSILCALQWQVNSGVNLRANRFELITQQQRAELNKDEQTIKSYAADLEDLRQRLTLSEKQLKDLDDKLAVETQDRIRIAAERDDLRSSLAKWMSAVADRDKTIIEARDRLAALTSDRNDAVQKFNDVVVKYNVLVKQWNAQQANH